MTAETDLLPLPETLIYGQDYYFPDQMRTYARANVAHAIAAKDAEIDALRTRLEDTVRDSTNKVEALRAEVERANSWNERVSVCRDHVADIVDGPCVICALDAAEARADDLRAEVAEWKAVAKWEREQHDSMFKEARALNERADKLAEALREVLIDLERSQANMRNAAKTDPRWEGCADAIQPRVDTARALLRDQEEGNG